MEKEIKRGKVTKVEPSHYHYAKQYEGSLFGRFRIDVDGVEYEVTMPIYLHEGEMFDFRVNGTTKTRSITENDQIAAMKELARCVGYTGVIEANDTSFRDFVLYVLNYRGEVNVTIYENCETVDRNGVTHRQCYLRGTGDFNVDAWMTKMFPHASTSTPRNTASAVPRKPAPPAPPAPKKSAPAAPAPKPVEATRNEAWAAFCAAYAPKKGEAWCFDNFTAEVEKVIGGEEEFATPELWGKCVEAFTDI